MCQHTTCSKHNASKGNMLQAQCNMLEASDSAWSMHLRTDPKDPWPWSYTHPGSQSILGARIHSCQEKSIALQRHCAVFPGTSKAHLQINWLTSGYYGAKALMCGAWRGQKTRHEKGDTFNAFCCGVCIYDIGDINNKNITNYFFSFVRV